MIYGQSSRVLHRHLKPTLTYAIASHINALARGKRFLELLSSIERQTVRAESAIISISFYTPTTPTDLAVRADILQRLAELGFITLIQTSQLAQFEHYQRVMRHLRDDRGFGRSNWLLFSDDDDLWHSERTEWYKKTTRMPKFYDCGVVRSLLDNGEQSTDGNYVDFAVQFSIFHEFFATIASPEMLRHRFCDVRFKRFLLERGCAQVGAFCIDQPVYHWRKDASFTRNSDRQQGTDAFAAIESNLELFFATFSQQTLDGWMQFSKKWQAACPKDALHGMSVNEFFVKLFVRRARTSVFRGSPERSVPFASGVE